MKVVAIDGEALLTAPVPQELQGRGY